MVEDESVAPKKITHAGNPGTSQAAPTASAPKPNPTGEPQASPSAAPATPPPKPQPAGEPKASYPTAPRLAIEARIVREVMVPATLSNILGQQTVSPAGVLAFFETYLKEAGDAKDPVERMLLEQMVITHHRLALLQVQAHAAVNPEMIDILNCAASRLIGEFRRLALAIQEYRLPKPQSFQVVHQQNIQTGGEQQVVYEQPDSKKKDFSPEQSELLDKAKKEKSLHGNFGRIGQYDADEKPAQGGSRAEKRPKAAAVGARRSPAPERAGTAH